MKNILITFFKPLCQFWVLISFLVFVGCTSENEEQQKINYELLDEIALEVELKITDSEDFIVSNLTGFYGTREGQLLITEKSGPGIHQFNSEGKYIKKVARDGRGPGEIANSWFHTHFNGVYLIATNNPGYNSAIYKQDDDGIFQFIMTRNQRHPGSFKGLRTEDDLYSFYSIDNEVLNRLQTPPEFSYSHINIIDIIDGTAAVTRSIDSLRVQSDFVEEFETGGVRVLSLPYRFSDSFQPLPNGHYLISRPEKETITIYNKELRIEKELKLNTLNRSVTSEDLEFHIGKRDISTQQKMRELIRDVKPAFMNVMMDNSNRFWLWTDETEKGKEYVILDYEGEPIGKVNLPSGETIEMISDNRLYVISEPEKDIPSAKVYSIDI